MQPQKKPIVSIAARAAIAATFGCVAACANVETTASKYPQAVEYSPRQTESVVIVREAPDAAYDRLGEIVVKSQVNPAPSETRIEEELRMAAALMGADAVVVVTDLTHHAVPGASQRWWAQTSPVEGSREVVGIAIKFR